MDVEAAKPEVYQVLFHNDDYTAMEFIVNIPITAFHKTADQTMNIMLAVYKRGKDIARAYPHEVAETKVDKTHFLTRGAGYLLRCTLEEVGA